MSDYENKKPIVVKFVMHFTFINKIEMGKFLDKYILVFCDIRTMRGD